MGNWSQSIMKKMFETIVFFGSGPVAAKSLAKLAEDFNIEAVITKPRPEHHKYPFPVLQVTDELGLKTFTPRSKIELVDLFKNKPVKSKIGVVIDYGIIIDKTVINYFPLGIINSHFSLLPVWRGPDPISFAILSGDTVSGISLMKIVEKLDEGPLLAQRTLPLTEGSTTLSLTKDLIDLSHELLRDTLPAYIDGKIEVKPQSGKATYSKKLVKQDGLLNWNKPAQVLEREIRAFYEWPRSFTKLGGKQIIITKAHVIVGNGVPGQIFLEGKQLGIYTKKDILVIEKLIPQGKKEMTSTEFLSGYKLSI